MINCHIVDNGLIGINLAEATVALTECTVARNEGIGTQGSVFIGSGTHFEARGTLFENNARGAMRVQDANRLLIEDCDVVDHSTRSAIQVFGCSNVTIRNSRFLRNATPATNGEGGAVDLSQSFATLEFNTFAYDSASVGFGGAVNVGQGSTATIRGNTFFRCQAAFTGSALAVSLSNVRVHNNVFVEGAGFGALAQTSATILPGSGCNILWRNSSDYYEWDADASATDVYLDPEFCGPESLDLTVSSSSPALPQNSPICGSIGAFGQGCGTIGVVPTTWGQLKSLYREPDKGR